MGIADCRRADRQFAVACGNHGSRFDDTFFQCQRNRERFHDRTGFERIRHGTVTQLRPGQGTSVIRVETRQVHHRQHFAGMRIQNDGTSRLGLVFLDSFTQILVGDVLQLAVDG